MKKLKKHEGSFIDSMIIPLISIVGLTAIILVIITGMKDSDVTFKVKEISRNYLLRIETKGYLDANAQEQLKKDLNNIGVYDVNLNGTTTIKANYGDEVHLNINGKYQVNTFTMDGLKLVKNKKVVEIKVDQESTGKH